MGEAMADFQTRRRRELLEGRGDPPATGVDPVLFVLSMRDEIELRRQRRAALADARRRAEELREAANKRPYAGKDD